MVSAHRAHGAYGDGGAQDAYGHPTEQGVKDTYGLLGRYGTEHIQIDFDACMYDVYEAYCAYAILSVIPIVPTASTASKVLMKLLVFWSLKSP